MNEPYQKLMLLITFPALLLLIGMQIYLYRDASGNAQRELVFDQKVNDVLWGIHEALEEQEIALSQDINKVIKWEGKHRKPDVQIRNWIEKEMSRMIDSVAHYYNFDEAYQFRIALDCRDCKRPEGFILGNAQFKTAKYSPAVFQVPLGYRIDDQDYELFLYYPHRSAFISNRASSWLFFSFIPLIVLLVFFTYQTAQTFLAKRFFPRGIGALEATKPLTKEKSPSLEHIFNIGSYLFDYPRHTLHYQDESQSLSRKEAEILKLLSENKNQVVEREVALQKIWGMSDYFSRRSMDVYISKLRKHLKQDQTVQIINVHGKGFILSEEQ